MEIVLMLLCIAGLSFAIKQVDGPFDLFAKVRNLVSRIPVLGPMFFHVLTCDFCLGLWSSVGLYLATNSLSDWALGDLVIWAFGGGMFNSLFSKMMSKLDVQV
jgi:hypothetical protein